MNFLYYILPAIFLCINPMPSQEENFKAAHLKNERVKQAYDDKGEKVEQLLKAANIKNVQLFIRAFKEEQILEVWGADKGSSYYKVLARYEFCASSGQLGPKRKQGDYQIPEGVYYIDRFNPWSNYYLSLGINYPNESDRKLSSNTNLGGDIFIHGDCVTIGCIPITDEYIKELYVMTVEAKNNGQEKIPVHIFPAMLTSEKYLSLIKEYDYDIDRISLWKNLKEVYEEFEMKHNIPEVSITVDGYYSIN